MKHARPDYDRIQDLSGKIPADEPVFLLRGQDAVAPWCVRQWADVVEARGGDPLLAKYAREQAERMDEWQRTVRCKMPDLPAPRRNKTDGGVP